MILYMRSVYPPDVFVRRRKWDVPVFQCNEASIQEYLTEVTKGIAEELDNVILESFHKTSLALTDSLGQPQEMCYSDP